MKFFLPGKPPKTTAQQKRLVQTSAGPLFYKGKVQQAAEATFTALLLPHRPARPLPAPLRLEIVAIWPWRTKDSKKIRALGRIPHIVRPDLDNWVKGFVDSLAQLRFIENDAQIADLRIRKYFGDKVGIYVRLCTITEISDGMNQVPIAAGGPVTTHPPKRKRHAERRGSEKRNDTKRTQESGPSAHRPGIGDLHAGNRENRHRRRFGRNNTHRRRISATLRISIVAGGYRIERILRQSEQPGRRRCNRQHRDWCATGDAAAAEHGAGPCATA